MGVASDRLAQLRRDRLGKAVAEARSGRGWSQEALARQAGISRRTIGKIERAEPGNIDEQTYIAVEVALEWPSGKCESMLQGSKPPEDAGLKELRRLWPLLAEEQREMLVKQARRLASL